MDLILPTETGHDPNGVEPDGHSPSPEPDRRLRALRDLRISERARPAATPRADTLKPRKLLVTIAALLGGAVLLGGIAIMTYGGGIELAKPRISAPTPPTQGPVGERLAEFDAAGFVVARRQATVAAEVTARVTSLPFEEGQAVKRGTVLARLDATAARTELATARAELGAAEAGVAAAVAQLSEARRAYERSDSLLERGFVTASRASADEAAMRTFEANLARARAQTDAQKLRIRRSEEELAKFTITAPFDGVVIGRNAQVGEMISPVSAGGGFTRTGICTLVDMESLEVEVDVSERYIGRIRLGEKATAVAEAYPNLRMPVRVAAIIPAANREKGTVTVRLSFIERGSHVFPNMAAKVRFGEDR